eukprot:1409284-Pyramimonas_sp.AAC.1
MEPTSGTTNQYCIGWYSVIGAPSVILSGPLLELSWAPDGAPWVHIEPLSGSSRGHPGSAPMSPQKPLM